MTDDSFTLYDLKIEWVAGAKPCWCGAKEGDYFLLQGEQIQMPPGQTWSIYTLSSLLTYLPAKQRATDANDWMTTDSEIACPDPNCGSRFRVTRTGTREFRHGDLTATPLRRSEPE